jgi:hypothetical protein
MQEQAGSRGWASKALDALALMGKVQNSSAVGWGTNYSPQSLRPASFSLPGPDDMGYLDQQIAGLASRPAAEGMSANPSLPCPQRCTYPTEEPPLTRQISDAFTMCYAFFKLGGAMQNGVLRVTLLGVPFLADEQLKQLFWDFFNHNWAYLDDTTRNWIVETALVWRQIQTRDSQGANLDPFERQKLSDYYGRNFEWFEAVLSQHQAQLAQRLGERSW